MALEEGGFANHATVELHFEKECRYQDWLRSTFDFRPHMCQHLNPEVGMILMSTICDTGQKPFKTALEDGFVGLKLMESLPSLEGSQ